MRSSFPSVLVGMVAVSGLLFGGLDTSIRSDIGHIVTRKARDQVAQIDPAVWEALTREPAVPVILNLHIPTETEGSSDEQEAAVARAQDTVIAQLTEPDFVLVHRYRYVPALSGALTAAGLVTAQTMPQVQSVQLDEPVTGHDSQSLAALRADVVQSAYGLTGNGVVVAVLDTGIDVAHPDFRDAIIAQQCFTHGDCQPGNVNQSNNASDLNGHGTNVSGIIGSRGAVSTNTLGFAPGTELVAVRVLDRYNSGWVSDFIAGMDWVYANQSTLHIRILNMSLGTYALYAGNCDSAWPAMAGIAQQLATAGVSIFASTGNQGSATSLASPACNSNVNAVGATYDGNLGRQPSSGTYNSLFGSGWPACFDATTSLGTISCFTNSNAQLAMVAPGVWITSSGRGGGSSTYAGTSQASPTAAGIAALMLEANPELTPTQIRAALRASGPQVTDPKNGLRFPRIDALMAVLANTQVGVNGPAWGQTNKAVRLSASVRPFSATMPLTYQWQATGQSPITITDPLNNTVQFVWTTPGVKTVTLTVTNSGGSFTVTHTVTINRRRLYVPNVLH